MDINSMRISYLFPIQFRILYQSCSLGCPKAALFQVMVTYPSPLTHLKWKMFLLSAAVRRMWSREYGSMNTQMCSWTTALPEGGWNISVNSYFSRNWLPLRASIHKELEASEKSPGGNRSCNIWRGWLRQGMKSKSWNKAKHNMMSVEL